MLKVVAVVAAVFVIGIAAVLILASTKADSFRVQRAITIQAPPEKIFPLISDFRRWSGWSPYEQKDPAMKRSYGGAESGKGATYAWDGDKNVGSGHMEIIDVSPPSKVIIKLDFLKPFEGHNTAEFTMLSQGNATNVSWAMHGPAPLLSRAIQVFIDFDKMIGSDFEAGLANLKKLTEN